MDEMLESEFAETRTTFYFDGTARWLRRDWARQCPHEILISRECQGVEGHDGEHWCFGADGSYHWARDKDHPEYKRAACGFTPPTANGYRTPAEMHLHYYMNHYEDCEVTDPVELERLNQGDFQPDESVDRPCTADEVKQLRAMGRLDEIEDGPPQ